MSCSIKRSLIPGGVILVSVALLLIAACSPSNKSYLREEGMAWNTSFHITYRSDSPLTDSILSILNEIDSSLSPFNPQSVVSRINDNRDSIADHHFANVYTESCRINELSGGVFDPTLAPLIRAWGFGQGHSLNEADTLKIDSLLCLVGIDKTKLENNVVKKENPATEFNFSAVAKGYGVDCIAEMFKRNGIVDYLVEVGGEIRASGVNPAGEFWAIGIDRPVIDACDDDIIEAIRLQNCGVATSGNYRNFQPTENGNVGHTISPHSGRPVKTDILSATVIAKNCMQADALATACMVLGSEKAMQLCDSLKVGVMLILEDMSSVRNVFFPEPISIN